MTGKLVPVRGLTLAGILQGLGLVQELAASRFGQSPEELDRYQQRHERD